MDLAKFLDRVRTSRQQNCFLHFTDRKNLALIKQHGLLSMAQLKKRGIVVPAPGGNEWSQDADAMCGMDEYVHLSFKTGHPMVSHALNDGRITDLVYVRVRPEVILLSGALVTDDVANKSGVSRKPPNAMLDAIDLDVLYNRMDWSDNDVQARLKAAEKCEVLVPDAVPAKYIENI